MRSGGTWSSSSQKNCDDDATRQAALDRARLALDGLSVGDAFGERFFGSPALVEALIEQRAVPAPPWFWTDDTAMALSVFIEHARASAEPTHAH